MMENGVGDIITVMNLAWQYAPATQATEPVPGLRNINCYVSRGTLTGIVGPTGSGKTTFAKTLIGLIPHCTAGTMNGFARVADMNVKSTSVSNLSTHIGYVGQDPRTQMTSATVHEEIAFPLENRGIDGEEIRARVEEVLDELHIGHLRDRAVDTLSTGEAERVAIASAIAPRPQVLILDEPISPLDREGRDDLVRVLARMREEEGTTVLLVEQDTDILSRHADAVFLMVDGEIIRRTTRDIFAREGALLESVGVIVPSDGGRDLSIGPATPAAAADAAVVLDHVRFSYPHATAHERTPLEDVSLTVGQGDFIGITGPNGSGKSTLVRLLNGILRPQAGKVTVGGADVTSRSVTQMAHQVAFVTQDPMSMLFGGTVHEEIAYGPRALGCDEATVASRVAAMVRLFDLYGVEDVPARTLSSGEQRAVALACALAMETPVLVLDEPVVGLDQRLKSRFLNTIAARNRQGTTVVMVCQDTDAIERYCTHAARLDEGHLVAYGTVRGSREPFVDPSSRQMGGMQG
ncbi:ABC transporter ATP-binding protein [Bifidobacterium cuniculi]|uniref:ABC transporter ATP-binding protein n=1 Tax=Bifidobacterium cuniculi TaxID=1688 RepID=A0A087B3V3_9BIFI|nr:ABC transporter ATP-binding protein [Bifidobacterium cuniculi]